MIQEVLDENDSILVIAQKRDDLLMEFVDNMNREFEKLLGTWTKEKTVVDFETLSLVQEDELNAMVAVEGMVASSRNLHLPSFISFNTRLGALFPETRIDESTNPLDPQQIASAFSTCIGGIGLDANNSLKVYRSFNAIVLKNIDKILREANQILIENGVIPDLGMDSVKAKPHPVRSAPRPPQPAQTEFNAFGTVEEEVFEPATENPEMFSMMQNLLHHEPPTQATAPQPGFGAPVQAQPGQAPGQQYAVPVSMLPDQGQTPGVMQPFQPAPGEQVQMVDQAQLMSILTNIQAALEERNSSGKREIPANLDEIEKVDISESLGEMLKDSQEEGVISAVDQQSSDIINLVTLLYDAIWQDESVPIPIKELIGRTQITIIKVALSDHTFFNREDHPARKLLNEFAEAGIGWTEVENLAEDPLYKKIEQIVSRIQTGFDGEVAFFEEQIADFRAFRAKEAGKSRKLEQSILKSKERQERLEDIRELVSQKITERVLGRELHPFVTELLEKHFHKFMVMLVVKEGPGSNAWKQSINTIDVLLWSVQPHEQEGDRNRLETVNPRLLNNLRKALRIAQLKPDEIDELISKLKAVQEETFAPEPEVEDSPELAIADDFEIDLNATESESAKTPANDLDQMIEPPAADQIEEGHPSLMQVDSLSVGTWVEFSVEDEQAIRCKLAAKINAIDKFIFVNRQGVKVVEKTRMGLAQELKDGTVKIISDGALFSRALESVIGNLRETQHEQQTGSAFNPNAESAKA